MYSSGNFMVSSIVWVWNCQIMTYEQGDCFSGCRLFLTKREAIAAHSSAAISLSMFVLEEWDCDKFWYIFGFCR